MRPSPLAYPLLGAVLFTSCSQSATLPEFILQKHTRGSLGAVASESKECSAIGRDLLARGGNAVDALVGTTFCVGAIGMYHSGIGGGGFAILRDSAGNYEAIDFRETAPASAFEDMYLNNTDASITGGLAVGIPGDVKGLEYMHKKYGVLSWNTVMQGAIYVSRHGFNVSSDLIYYMNRTLDGNGETYLTKDPVFAAEFAPDGHLVKEGSIITRERYANTLERIANEGADVFYKGDVAKSMVKFIQKTGGTMTLADLENYKVISRKVYSVPFRGLNLFSLGAPAGGVVGLQILKIMEGFSPSWANATLSAHRFIEAMRHGYAARISLGDPPFVDEDVEAFEARMLDPQNIERIRGRIKDDASFAPPYYNPEDVYAPDSHGTSHIVTADKSGMAVSLTSTVNLLFGAKIMDPETGIILNNEMNDFSIPGVSNEFGLPPSKANFIRPGKRPLSSITPIIAEHPNGTLYAVIGAAGGSRIISATAQCLWHVVEHDLTMAEALAEPRMHDQLSPDRVTLESWFDERVAEDLRALGHNVEHAKPRLSSVQGILRRLDGTFEAASEPRQENSRGYTI